MSNKEEVVVAVEDEDLLMEEYDEGSWDRHSSEKEYFDSYEGEG